jgi:hypothetical protein
MTALGLLLILPSAAIFWTPIVLAFGWTPVVVFIVAALAYALGCDHAKGHE